MNSMKQMLLKEFKFLINKHKLLGGMDEANKCLNYLICKLMDDEGYYCTKRTGQIIFHLVKCILVLSNTEYFDCYSHRQELFHAYAIILYTIHSNRQKIY